MLSLNNKNLEIYNLYFIDIIVKSQLSSFSVYSFPLITHLSINLNEEEYTKNLSSNQNCREAYYY